MKTVRHQFLGKGSNHIFIIIGKDRWVFGQPYQINLVQVLFYPINQKWMGGYKIPIYSLGILFKQRASILIKRQRFPFDKIRVLFK